MMNLKISEWYGDRPEIITGKKLICRNASNGSELIRREAERLGGVAGIEAVTIADLAAKTTAERLSQQAGSDIINPNSAPEGGLTLMTLINSRIGELEYGSEEFGSREEFEAHVHRILTRNTAEELMRIINMIRMNKAQEKLLAMSKGEYDKKASFSKNAVYRFGRLYKCLGFYTGHLKANGIYDGPRLLEDAVEYLKELKSQGRRSVIQLPEYAVLDDLVPTKLESEFLGLLGADERVIKASGSSAAEKGFVRAYGMADEIRYAADRIAGRDGKKGGDGTGRLYPGDVAVWYTNSSYRNMIRSVFSSQNIPVSFVSGMPAAEKDAFMLFIDILDWMKNDCSYDLLAKLINNRAIEFRVSDKKDAPTLRKRDLINYFGNIGYIYELSSYERIARGAGDETADADFLEEDGEIAYNDPCILKLTEVTAKKFIAGLVETVLPDDREKSLYDPEKLFVRMYAFFKKYCASKGEVLTQFPAVEALIKNIGRSLSTGGKAVFTLRETDKMIRDIIENENTGAESSKETVSAQLASSQRVVSSRKYNFIVGMSSDLMLRKTDESPVMYDAEIRQCFDKGDSELLIRQYLGAAKNKLINDSLEYLTSTLPQDSTVIFSYPDYDPVRLCVRSKTDIYERMLREYGEGREVSFNSLDPGQAESFLYETKDASAESGSGVIVGNVVDFLFKQNEMINMIKADNKREDRTLTDEELTELAKESALPAKNRLELSSTGLECLLSCPMKYACRYIYKLKEEPEYPVEKLSWLDSREKGLFFHRVMELYYGTGLTGRTEENQLGTPAGFDGFNEAAFENAMKITTDEFDLLPVAVERIKQAELDEIKTAAETYLRKMTARYGSKEYGYLPCAAEYKWKKPEEDDVIDLSGFAPEGERTEIRLNYREGSVDRLEMKRGKDGRVHLAIADYKTGRLETFLKNHAGLLVQHYVYKFSVEHGMTEVNAPVVDRFEFHFPFDESRLCYHYRKGSFVPAGVSDVTCVVIDNEDVFELSDKIKALLCSFVRSDERTYSTCDKVIEAEAAFDAVPDENGNLVMMSQAELELAVKNRCEYCRFGELCGIKYSRNEGGSDDDDDK